VSSWPLLTLTAVVVLVIDQAVKFLVHHVGGLRVVEGQLWMHRPSVGRRNPLWLWLLPAAVLVLGSAWIPSSALFVGLLLGGSLSNAVEGSLRGSVTDYICLRIWPAFNLADVALTIGAIGIAVELLRTVSGTAG
jgi:signal peptidase II